jgi:hypothetical protein
LNTSWTYYPPFEDYLNLCELSFIINNPERNAEEKELGNKIHQAIKEDKHPGTFYVVLKRLKRVLLNAHDDESWGTLKALKDDFSPTSPKVANPLQEFIQWHQDRNTKTADDLSLSPMRLSRS